METKTNDFEERASNAYLRFGSLARKYYYTFKRSSVTRGGTPCMVFLGNHSSGKSSLIHWTLGGSPVQDVGLAPTDDGFTVILFTPILTMLLRGFTEIPKAAGGLVLYIVVFLMNILIL